MRFTNKEINNSNYENENEPNQEIKKEIDNKEKEILEGLYSNILKHFFSKDLIKKSNVYLNILKSTPKDKIIIINKLLKKIPKNQEYLEILLSYNFDLESFYKLDKLFNFSKEDITKILSTENLNLESIVNVKNHLKDNFTKLNLLNLISKTKDFNYLIKLSNRYKDINNLLTYIQAIDIQDPNLFYELYVSSKYNDSIKSTIDFWEKLRKKYIHTNEEGISSNELLISNLEGLNIFAKNKKINKKKIKELIDNDINGKINFKNLGILINNFNINLKDSIKYYELLLPYNIELDNLEEMKDNFDDKFNIQTLIHISKLGWELSDILDLKDYFTHMTLKDLLKIQKLGLTPYNLTYFIPIKDENGKILKTDISMYTEKEEQIDELKKIENNLPKGKKITFSDIVKAIK